GVVACGVVEEAHVLGVGTEGVGGAGAAEGAVEGVPVTAGEPLAGSDPPRVEGDQVVGLAYVLTETRGVQGVHPGGTGAAVVEDERALAPVGPARGGVAGRGQVEGPPVGVVGVQGDGEGSALQSPQAVAVAAEPGEEGEVLLVVAGGPGHAPAVEGLLLPGRAARDQDGAQSDGGRSPVTHACPPRVCRAPILSAAGDRRGEAEGGSGQR